VNVDLIMIMDYAVLDDDGVMLNLMMMEVMKHMMMMMEVMLHLIMMDVMTTYIHDHDE